MSSPNVVDLHGDAGDQVPVEEDLEPMEAGWERLGEVDANVGREVVRMAHEVKVTEYRASVYRAEMVDPDVWVCLNPESFEPEEEANTVDRDLAGRGAR